MSASNISFTKFTPTAFALFSWRIPIEVFGLLKRHKLTSNFLWSNLANAIPSGDVEVVNVAIFR